LQTARVNLILMFVTRSSRSTRSVPLGPRGSHQPEAEAAAVAHVAPLAGIPFLAVYGDDIESRGQSGRLEACRETARHIREAGGIGDILSLPDEGIRGNTHLLMLDNISAEIAGRIMDWIDKLPAK
jgi:hypothetical protein